MIPLHNCWSIVQSDGTNGIQLNDINSNVQMINTYKDIIKGPVILGGVKERFGP